MRKVRAAKFRDYAARNQDRWNLMVGMQVLHPALGNGQVSEVKVKDGDISIWIDFVQPNGGAKEKCFGPQVMNLLGDLELPDAVARQIDGALAGRPQPFPSINQPVINSASSPREVEVLPQQPAPKFSVNQTVCLARNSSERGLVTRVSVFAAGEWNYDVFFSKDDHRTYRESALMPYEPLVRMGGLQEFLRDLALVKLRKPLGDALYALYSSRTKFEVYQFKPAVKFLTNPDQRLLIADEVGLGKTIEAGIIYLELQARIGLERVLVVCPSSLRHKWQDEFKSRFDEEFTILDMEGARTFLTRYNQFAGQVRMRGIISLELIRRREIAEAFSNVKLDLLIIDEAHHCRNTATLANAIASNLTENSDAALLLTATPLQMGQQDLFNLLNILSPGEFDNFDAFSERLIPNQYINLASQYLAIGDRVKSLAILRKVEQTSEKKRFLGNPYYQNVVRILSSVNPSQQELITAQRRLLELSTLSTVLTRTRKRDIQENAPLRTASTLTVRFTPEEKAFYDQVVEEVRHNFERTHGRGAGSGWVTIMKERQAASCISALRKKQSGNPGVAEDFGKEVFEKDFVGSEELPEEEQEDSENEKRTDLSFILERPRKKLSQRLNLQPVQKDTKFETFWRALQNVLAEDPASKVLVFSFFVGTIEHIENELRWRGINVRAIHGRIPVKERQKIIEEFHDDPAIRVLVSSDVGSEGLDFQFCDTLFNYDLPWNPMKVEQRIGRVDRFGQQSDRIRIYNLVIDDTIETRILMRLYDRIEIFKHSIGDIEVILGDQIRELTQAVFSNRLSPQEEIRRAEQAATNILRRKQEMEEFEQKKLQFLGQEKILSQTIEKTIESGRFVSEAEVHALVEGYIKANFPLTRLQANGPDDATYTLFANSDLVEAIKVFILGERKNDLSSQQFLTKLIPGKEIPLTFSYDLAYQRKLLEFITPRHPLAQAALEYWKKQSETYSHLSCLRIKTNDVPAGRYFFFIYSIDSQGIDQNSRLVAVAISEQTCSVDEALSRQLLRFVQTSATTMSMALESVDETWLEKAEECALQFITRMRDELHRELLASNESIVNARLAAVEQSYQAKRRRIEEINLKVKNASIQRMYEGQLRNLAAKRKARISEIEEGRHVEVSFSMHLRGLLNVDG